MATAPTFARGGDAAQEADEAVRAASGGSFRRVHYLPKIGPGKQIFLRYLTDSPEWFYAKAHPSAPTKNASADWPKERKWPESMPAVCRYDDAFKGIHSDCYICDAKLTNQWGRQCNPVVRVWALAVIREEVIGTQDMVGEGPGKIPADKVGKRVGFKDATREVKVVGPDGKETDQTETELAIIVVNQAVKNYFGGLQSAFEAYGTICDRDYIVKQNGDGKDVDYVHMPLPETPNLNPTTEKWAKYPAAIEKQGNLDIAAMLVDRASDDFFALFFDPSKEPPKREKKGEGGQAASNSSGGAPASQQAATPGSEPDQARLEAMRNRLRGKDGEAAEAPADTPAETASEPAQEPAAAAAGSMVDYD